MGGWGSFRPKETTLPLGGEVVCPLCKSEDEALPDPSPTEPEELPGATDTTQEGSLGWKAVGEVLSRPARKTSAALLSPNLNYSELFQRLEHCYRLAESSKRGTISSFNLA